MSGTQNARTTVVLVEDDASLLNALTFALGADGFDARPYRDAETLLAEAPRIRPDCLVIDLKLPSLDGLSLLSMLREKEIHAPAILITSNPDPRSERRARAAGIPIVEKPLVNEALRIAIERAIGQPGAG